MIAEAAGAGGGGAFRRCCKEIQALVRLADPNAAGNRAGAIAVTTYLWNILI